jgi:nucleotide-binding universal stress UspA family protein
MDPLKKSVILVPTDFSEVCDNAINQACEAAHSLGYSITLLHVLNSDSRTWMKSEGLDEGGLEFRLKELAQQKQDKYGLEVNILTREGSIFTTIAEVAQDEGASLIYLGTHGKSGMQKLTGSFAIKVVTSSEVPVVVVQKRPFEKGYKDIVLPITSEAGPMEKTRWAAFMAKTFGAKVHIFQVDESESILETVKSLEDFLKKESVAVKTVVAERSSGFSKQVLDYATSNNADLILIMTSPDKNWTSFLLGTYDEEMIFNTSQIPVMCINPRKYNWEKIFRS